MIMALLGDMVGDEVNACEDDAGFEGPAAAFRGVLGSSGTWNVWATALHWYVQAAGRLAHPTGAAHGSLPKVFLIPKFG